MNGVWDRENGSETEMRHIRAAGDAVFPIPRVGRPSPRRRARPVALLLLATAALGIWTSIAPAQSPVAPEENLTIIRVRHRDAGDVARTAEEVLIRTLAPGEMDRGILTVDPGLNAIIVRAAGPGATWPASVRKIVSELDQPTAGATLKITLWRTGWSPRQAPSEREKAEAEAVLGSEAGEKLDTFSVPVETGTYFSAWLESPGKPPVHAVGVAGPDDGQGKSVRLLPLRVEIVDSAGLGAESPSSEEGVRLEPQPRGDSTGGVAPVGPTATSPGRDAQAAGAAPAASGNLGRDAQATGAAPAAPPSSGENPETAAAEPASPLLPPPYGEVVFAGPLTARFGRPTVVGPFSVPGLEGQLVVAVELVDTTGGGR